MIKLNYISSTFDKYKIKKRKSDYCVYAHNCDKDNYNCYVGEFCPFFLYNTQYADFYEMFPVSWHFVFKKEFDKLWEGTKEQRG